LQENSDKSLAEINPEVIADNGSKFVGEEFREIIGVYQGKNVRITTYHQQSNGTEARFHRTLRGKGVTLYKSLIEANQKVSQWIKYYSTSRLHSSIRYMPPEVWHYDNLKFLVEMR